MGTIKKKKGLVNLISRQFEFCQRSLTDMLDLCDNLKYRWIMAFKSNTHTISQSSLAEAADASIKTGGKKMFSQLMQHTVASQGPLDSKQNDIK